MARKSSSLSRSWASISFFSSTIALSAAFDSASDSLIASSSLRACRRSLTSRALTTIPSTIPSPMRFVATISSQRYSPSPPLMRTSNGRDVEPTPPARSGPKTSAMSSASSGCTMPRSVKLRPDVEPREPDGRRARVLDVAHLVVDEHEVGRVLGQRPEPRLAVAHRLLGAHAGQRRDQRVTDDAEGLPLLTAATRRFGPPRERDRADGLLGAGQPVVVRAQLRRDAAARTRRGCGPALARARWPGR